VLNAWATENNMMINKSKTIYQFFSLQHNNTDFNLKIDNQLLQKSASTKYMGVLFDNKINWADHISKTVEKTNKRIRLMKRPPGAKWGSTQDTLKVYYNTYVKPIMKYGSEVTEPSKKSNLKHLETAQNNTLRILCGAVKITPVTALQLYTENLPISLEIQKQAAATFIK
jgi:hypothetical protein